MSTGGDPDASAMAAQICDQIRSVFSAQPSPYGSPLEVLVEEIAAAAGRGNRVFVRGLGREALMLRALCMRLDHLGVAAHPVEDATTPPAAPGDLLLVSAGSGGFSDYGRICGVARAAGARVVLLTAQPESGSEGRRCADRVALLPPQATSDEEAEGGDGEDKRLGSPRLKLPMKSLYEGAAFVLFEMVVSRLEVVLGCTPEKLRSRHRNLEQ
ncbi:hypothetical protein Taro_045323 [Colocasia esculenta]|uniref:SIS domain-containing protein n=1 Tax=Colocasia esculenta TaxID=4460 RepID=A0A843X008_COLES|nr:hypothetical protein [Colocasia esculenta]